MDNEKIKIKIIREDTIIVTKSMLAKFSTPSDINSPTLDIEGKRYYVTSWTAKTKLADEINDMGLEPDYRISLVGADVWELT